MAPIMESENAQQQIKKEVERVAFERKFRDLIAELVQTRQKATNKEKKWLKNFQKFLNDHRVMDEIDSKVFQECENVYRGLKMNTEAVGRDTESLINLKKSLRKTEDQPLRGAIDRTLASIRETKELADELDKKADKLCKDINNLESQLNSCTSKSTESKKLQERIDKLAKKLDKTDKQLEDEDDSYENACKEYPKTEEELVKQSIKNETERLQEIDAVLKKFISTLKIEVPESPRDELKKGTKRQTSLRERTQRRKSSIRRINSEPTDTK